MTYAFSYLLAGLLVVLVIAAYEFRYHDGGLDKARTIIGKTLIVILLWPWMFPFWIYEVKPHKKIWRAK